MTFIAQDTFVVTHDDGSQVRVSRGEAFPDGHPLVKLDQSGAGVLFKKMDLGDGEAPKSRLSRKGAS